MKKLCIFSLAALVIAGILLTSCNNAVSSRPTLNTVNDSLSYSYGVNLYESGLGDYLKQAGVLADTNAVKSTYLHQISTAKDETAKATLQKEMKAKVDSVQNANRKSIAEFVRGLSEGINATKAQDSYIQGLSIGKQISEQMLPRFQSQLFGPESEENLDKSLVASGVAIAMANSKPAIANASLYLNSAMEKIRVADEEKKLEFKAQQEMTEKTFLEENGKKAGITTLPSGLQYKVLTAGSGATPKASDRVKVLYKGSLLNGTVFDSAQDAGHPVQFGVTQVIKGWTEALQLMPAGSKWEIYVPAALAYGSQERPTIPAYSPLIFEIELLGIE